MAEKDPSFGCVDDLKTSANTPHPDGGTRRGLYIHIPFCRRKCGYCDFYSFVPAKNQMDSYLEAVLSSLESWSGRINGSFDTIYFGGGTPSFFGGERIAAVLAKAKNCFDFCADTEITVECNPSCADERLFYTLRRAGVDRVSMGLQSAVESERKAIGRQSGEAEAKRAVLLAQKSAFENISLDLMLGLPHQTAATLDESLDFIIESSVCHVSAYILKVEPNTPLGRACPPLPDEDEVCELYLHTAQRLERAGLAQYEISNFAAEGRQSRHNMKYWRCGEYLGIGPSAHSFINGRRFFYPPDIQAFMDGAPPTDDGAGGDEEEYVMLGLRLNSGVERSGYFSRYKKDIPSEYVRRAKAMEKYGLTVVDGRGIRLTRKGFLLSNRVIGEILS